MSGIVNLIAVKTFNRRQYGKNKKLKKNINVGLINIIFFYTFPEDLTFKFFFLLVDEIEPPIRDLPLPRILAARSSSLLLRPI